MIIGIVGLGLIGGSLGLALRQDGTGKFPHRVLGVSRQQATCYLAVERGVVDEASQDFACLSDADLIFLCTPIASIAPTVQHLTPYLTSATVLTDVGSVKASIVAAISPLWPNFVGGHPMAGTAESGLDAAQGDLFVDRPYVLTPTPTTPPEALARVASVVDLLQSRLYYCSPEDHDRAVAWISHLPVMVSASLIQACLQEPNPALLQLAQHLASSGFRDTSRVGGGNPELGMMMAQYNRVALVQALAVYRQQLDQMIGLIDQEDWSGLEAMLHQTQQARPAFVQ